jgi:hypothetical protein
VFLLPELRGKVNGKDRYDDRRGGRVRVGWSKGRTETKGKKEKERMCKWRLEGVDYLLSFCKEFSERVCSGGTQVKVRKAEAGSNRTKRKER